MPALVEIALAGLLGLGSLFGPATSDLRADEELRLFPALAFPTPSGAWEVHMRAWVFEPEEGSWWRGLALGALRRALELPAGSEANAYFQARAGAFMVDNERSKEIVVRFGGADHRLPPTAPSGHTLARFVVAADALDRGATPVAAVLRRGDDRHIEGSVLRLDPGALSVVSDIDDTIKISEVRDLQALLANTFLRPFAAVPELPAVYQRWADRGVLFHYVSASPWHLYDPLREFIVAAGYPLGSFHLKDFRWKDSTFLSLVQDPESYKLAAIEPLLTRAADHRFALVGDSGEADPEAYAELYRRHPDQVVHIYIRDVSGESREAPRYETTFAGVPVDRWTIFTDARELPEAPPRTVAPSPAAPSPAAPSPAG